MSSESNPVFTATKLNDGREIPLLGLGTARYDKKVLEAAIEEAVRIGYRHFDTAFMYANESELGEIFQKLMQDGKVKREELFITTKLSMNQHRPHLVQPCLEGSLSRLKLDYVDLYLVHNPCGMKSNTSELDLSNDNWQQEFFDEEADPLDTWKAMQKCRESGLARSIGVSNFNQSQIERLIREGGGVRPAVNQIESHPFLTNSALIRYLLSENILPTLYCPLGKPNNSNPPLDQVAEFVQVAREIGKTTQQLVEIYQQQPSTLSAEQQKKLERAQLLNDTIRPQNILQDPVVLRLAEHYAYTPAQVLLSYALSRHCSVIPKSNSPIRLAENWKARELRISDEHVAQLDALNRDARVCHFTELQSHKYFPF